MSLVSLILVEQFGGNTKCTLKSSVLLMASYNLPHSALLHCCCIIYMHTCTCTHKLKAFFNLALQKPPSFARSTSRLDLQLASKWSGLVNIEVFAFWLLDFQSHSTFLDRKPHLEGEQPLSDLAAQLFSSALCMAFECWLFLSVSSQKELASRSIWWLGRCHRDSVFEAASGSVTGFCYQETKLARASLELPFSIKPSLSHRPLCVV